MKKSIKLFLVFVLIVLSFSGCNDEENDTIKIGFIAGLSGKYSALGTSIRDGFLLAFDEIDYKIDNKSITIIQKDDRQDPKVAKKVIEELIEKDIKLIVGNVTSSMTKISIEALKNHQNRLLISPTASGDEFSKKDDNFLRIQEENSEKRYQTLLKYIQKKGYKDIFLIYDSNNISYVNGYKTIFQNLFIKNGGEKFVGNSDINNNYNHIVDNLKTTKNDLILIVGNSIDTANMIQYIRHKKIKTDILGSGWAKTMDFITNGGKAVEGVVFSTAYDDNSKNKNFLEFIKKFEEKYNKKPSVFAAQGYELAIILIKNLQKSTDTETLKTRILQTPKYSGLQGSILFDKYGDISREYFVMEVKNRLFQKID